MSQLVVMGSGETAPTMVKVHRQVIQATTGIGPSVLLDTPFGFQLNADDLVDKTLGYFADSVGSRVELARWHYQKALDAGHPRNPELEKALDANGTPAAP